MSTPAAMPDASRSATLILGIDFEDWEQLVARHLGRDDWDRRWPAFERQVAALLGALDALGTRATFFLLGASARHHPDLVQEVVRRGHEIACHGHAHRPVHGQSPDEFRRDVAEAVDAIVRLTGSPPSGFRAPIFSIDRTVTWAFEILAELGFQWDSSLHDSPRCRRRLRGIPLEPFPLRLDSGQVLWEFPVATAPFGPIVLPVGGGGYWRVLPTAFILDALRRRARTTPWAPLYFHPYEFDPLPLRAPRPRVASLPRRLRVAWVDMRYALGRGRACRSLSRVARAFPVTTHGEALQRIRGTGVRERSLSQGGLVLRRTL